MAKKPAKKAAKKPATTAKATKPVARYNAAGISEAGVRRIIAAAEYNRMGRPGYPWSTAVKNEMAKSINGCRTLEEVQAVVSRLTLLGA